MGAANARIVSVRARRLLDGQGSPALEAEVRLANGAVGRATVATAADVDSARAIGGGAMALIDGGAVFGGRGLQRAMALIADEIAPALTDCDATDQAGIDRNLASVLAGGPRGAVLARPGANATLAVSLACARAAARTRGLPLWRSLPAQPMETLPVPVVDIIEADPRQLGCRRIAILPLGAETIGDALDWSAEVMRAAGAALARTGLAPLRGVRGGWQGPFEELSLAMDFVVGAIEQTGLTPGEDIALALDIAAGAFGAAGSYLIGATGERIDTRGMIARAQALLRRSPVAVLVDPLGPDAGAAWPELTRVAGRNVRIAMRAALAGSPVRIAQAAEAGAANAVAVEPAQQATLTAIVAAAAAGRAGGWITMLEGSAAECEDDWLAEVAVGLGAEMLAAGGVFGGERTAKWNALMRLSAALPAGGRLAAARAQGA